jgi:acyl-CoA synthetase (AMP-forming)/AMP-acid ligase II
MNDADTFRELYFRSCKWRGNLDFFVDPGERISGTAALDASRRLAAGFRSLGAGKGEVIAFLCRSSVRHALCHFAGLISGVVVCSLHVRESPERLGETLAWLGARVLVHDHDLAELADAALRRATSPCVPVSLHAAQGSRRDYASLMAAPPFDPATIPLSPDDLGAIILSSGSTGRPKGVMHTQRTLVENAKAGQMLYGGITVHDATLIMMQPSFAAWNNVVLPYVGGRAKVAFGGDFEREDFLATLARERITMAPAVPTMWRMVFAAETGAHDLSALRCVAISGESPSQSDLEQIHSRICRNMAIFYASSEAACAASVLATTADVLGNGKPATTGKPVLGADMRIVDPAGSVDDELPRGETGEIAVAGPSLAIGYWKDPQLTRERFARGWWRSGDMGYIDAEGDLFVQGRTDNVINSGGIKVHGEEIEAALLRHPGVAQAAVIGVRDERWGERIEAHVILRQAGVTAEELDLFCRTTAGLAGFKVPKAFHFVAQLPTGPTGKLYRRGLRGNG